jgi:hypothetical protein
MANSNDRKKIEQVMREIIILESKYLNEPRPRNMSEKIVKIIKDIYSDEHNN